MLKRRFPLPIVLIILVLATVARVSAGATEKHSGTVVAIDSRAGVLTIAEVGAAPVVAGKAQVTEQTFVLTRATEYAMFRRVNVPGKFPGDFTEVALAASDVAVGDQATVECTRQGGRVVALKVALADPTTAPVAAVTREPGEVKPLLPKEEAIPSSAAAARPLPAAAAAMPRVPVTEPAGPSPSGSESRPAPEVVRPRSPAVSTEDPRSVIDWLLNRGRR